MAESLVYSSDALFEEFDRILQEVVAVKAEDNCFKTLGTSDLNKLKAAQIKIKTDLIDKELTEHSLPVGNSIVVGEKLNEHLEDLNKQFINEVIPHLQSNKEASVRLLEKTSLELNHQLQIAKSMNDCLSELQNDTRRLNQTFNIQQSVQFYNTEQKTTEKLRRDLQKKMAKFIKEHLPANHSAMNEEQPLILRQLGAVRNTSQTYTKLTQFLKLLLQACFDSPQNPFVDLTQHPVFPPYLELLLRSDIIYRHKENFNLVRLSYVGS